MLLEHKVFSALKNVYTFSTLHHRAQIKLYINFSQPTMSLVQAKFQAFLSLFYCTMKLKIFYSLLNRRNDLIRGVQLQILLKLCSCFSLAQVACKKRILCQVASNKGARLYTYIKKLSNQDIFNNMTPFTAGLRKPPLFRQSRDRQYWEGRLYKPLLN